MAGADNDRGIVGIAPHAARVSVASHYRGSDKTEGLVTDAIAAILASGDVTDGDVLLLEVQDGNNLPIEMDDAVFIAIGNAIALGIIVVEAAGNGSLDLDTVVALNAKDSGAIVVGASLAGLDATATGHDRWVIATPGPGSNFGARVDCYAYGEGVVTTGPAFNPACVLGSGTRATNQYRCDFGGTSAAAAIVAGAAVALQGLTSQRQRDSSFSTSDAQRFSNVRNAARCGHAGKDRVDAGSQGGCAVARTRTVQDEAAIGTSRCTRDSLNEVNPTPASRAFLTARRSAARHEDSRTLVAPRATPGPPHVRPPPPPGDRAPGYAHPERRAPAPAAGRDVATR